MKDYQGDQNPMSTKTASYTIEFNERGIKSALKKHTGTFILRDIHIKGLTLKVTSKSKTYYLDKKINGKVYHRKIDDYSNISPSNSRDLASDLISSLRKDIDPKKIRKAKQAKEIILNLTIQQALDNFITESPALADATIKGYKRAIKLCFGDIKNNSILSVTSEQINSLHAKRSETTKAKADHDMRVFRLLWNWVIIKYKEEYPEIETLANPVKKALNSGHRAGVKGWNKVPRKQSIIPRKKLPIWFQSLNKVKISYSRDKNRESVANFTETLILTGLRFNEAASLPWNKVDFVKEILFVEDKSSKNRQELIKPITTRVAEILEQQKGKHEIYVFPGNVDYIKDTRGFRASLIQDSGIEFSNHDLRRVYLSAGSRADVSSDILKRLVNHLPKTQDVTAGYIIQSLDELQEYAQKIENQILLDAGLIDNSIDNTLLKLLIGLSEEEKIKIIDRLSDKPTSKNKET